MVKNLFRYSKYLKYLLKHKWYVMLECFKYHLYWRGIIHDLSKFSIFEARIYADFFFGEGSPDFKGNFEVIRDFDKNREERYDYAINRHYHKSPHHWQYWIVYQDNGNIKILDIPYKYLIEMICDWQGASKSIRGKDALAKDWYLRQKNKILLSFKTRVQVEKFLFGG